MTKEELKLLDQFAIAALSGLIPAIYRRRPNEEWLLAEIAYRFAGFMMKERQESIKESQK